MGRCIFLEAKCGGGNIFPAGATFETLETEIQVRQIDTGGRWR